MMNLVAAQTVRIPKTAEIVASRIRRAIILGELKAGGNLPPEAELIVQFAVSRPTLREAIRILESESLITISRGARKGATILAPSADMISRAAGIVLQAVGATIGDVYQARILIEPKAARLAAGANPQQAADALDAIVRIEKDRADARNVVALQRATSDYHRVLMESSGNMTLAMIAYALDDLVLRHQAMVNKTKPFDHSDARWTEIRYGLGSHARLSNLIRAGDAAGAEDHWTRHMVNAGKFWLDEFAETAVIDILD